MIKKILILLFVILCIGGCRHQERIQPSTIESIAYDVDKSHGYTVYITESEEYVPYLVLTNDYNGNCLLVRKYLLDETRRFNKTNNYLIEVPSYYENSEIDIFLNESFYDCLSDSLKNILIDTQLEITDKNAIGSAKRLTCYINRKIFLLSAYEVDTPCFSGVPIEGKTLEFFETFENKIAFHKNSENAASWYLRSPATSFTNVNTAVLYHGGTAVAPMCVLGEEVVKGGVRPAFCIPNDTTITTTSIDDSFVYTLD